MGSSVVSPCYAVTCGLLEVSYLSSRRPFGHYRMAFLLFSSMRGGRLTDVAASFLSSCRGSWGGTVRARFHVLSLASVQSCSFCCSSVSPLSPVHRNEGISGQVSGLRRLSRVLAPTVMVLVLVTVWTRTIISIASNYAETAQILQA